MSNDVLIEILRKYVNIFLDEYGKYLDKKQLDILRSINYENIFSFEDITYPLGMIILNKIYLSNRVNDLIKTMENMPSYHTKNTELNNSNFSNYLKYICENGYDTVNYYADHLMYLVFKMVLRNNSGLIDGFLNKEIIYLSNKYRIRMANLYKREEVIAEKFIKVISRDSMLKILFMDRPSAFKYLCEVNGYRYANLFYDISNLIDDKYKALSLKDYHGFDGIINYARDYDSIPYGEVYNCLLDFNVKNNLL